MKKLISAAVFAAIGTSAQAGDLVVYENVYDPTFYIGLGWTFGADGGKAGVSAKVLSSNKPDAVVGAAGVSLNFDGSIGCDLGIGLNDNDVSLTAGYDFCQRGPVVGLGVITNDAGRRAVGPQPVIIETTDVD